MKKICLVLLLILLGFAPVFADNYAPDWVSEIQSEDDEYYYFVGLGNSKNFKIALKKAQADCRIRVAEYLNKKVEEVVNDYVNESGDQQGSWLSESFESLSVQRTSAIIKGMRFVGWYKSDDSDDVWVLMKVAKKYLDSELDVEKVSPSISQDILGFGKAGLMKQIEENREKKDTPIEAETIIQDKQANDLNNADSKDSENNIPPSSKDEVVVDEITDKESLRETNAPLTNKVDIKKAADPNSISISIKPEKSSTPSFDLKDIVTEIPESFALELPKTSVDNQESSAEIQKAPTKAKISLLDNVPFKEKYSGTIELEKRLEAI